MSLKDQAIEVKARLKANAVAREAIYSEMNALYAQQLDCKHIVNGDSCTQCGLSVDTIDRLIRQSQ